MRLLDRYLLRELLVPFGFCLSGFTVIWTMFNWAMRGDDFREAGLHFKDVMEYYLVKLPEFLVLLLPIAFLLALLYALTQHARYNEITAMRAAGVSLWRLGAPYFAVGLVATFVVFALNEFLTPDANDSAERIMRRYAGKKNLPDRNLISDFGFNNEREHRTWKMTAYNQRTSEMTNLMVICTPPGGLQRWVSAEYARPLDGKWIFYNVTEFREPPDTRMLASHLRTNRMIMNEFTETPESIQSEVKISARLKSVAEGKMKRPDVPIVELLEYLRLHPDLPKQSWVHTVLWGRLAAPWKCLVVVLIALPFGAASGRRNVFVGVASSIFICLAFHILSEVSLAFGTGGYVPPWVGGWLPNIVFGAAGLWMTARVR